MVLKHMLTTKCSRGCSYCITRNVPVMEGLVKFASLRAKYRQLREAGHREIMLTGGEPTCHPLYSAIVRLAWQTFDAVHLTTQNEEVLVGRYKTSNRLLSSVVFSIHDRSVRLPIELEYPFPVYAAVMDRFFFPSLVDWLISRGFSGLTINEDVRGTERFDTYRLPVTKPNFSIRVNRRERCLAGAERLILPDLTEVQDFGSYL